MKKFALTIKRHWEGILNSFESKLTNGRVEGINSVIQTAEARARGYSTSKNLILVVYLIAGKLIHLPDPPFKKSPILTTQTTYATENNMDELPTEFKKEPEL